MQCPVCKADNTQGPQCRRCKADLSLLFRLENQRAATLAKACQCLREGRAVEALRLAVQANEMRSDADSRRVVAVASLVSRQFEQAFRCGLQGR